MSSLSDPQDETPSRLGAPLVLRNPRATAGLALGIASLIVNPVLLTSIIGIVVSALGLSRATRMTEVGYAPVGRSKAIWGLGLSILGLVSSLALKSGMF
ncbi:hypothetical protein ACGIF2_11835 [Cellulomonas sp. P22]|uniref:hypothetical protein n=1 Tax=Cellulomonas sp. P22 TaxID=3373189 RepID=UPI00379571ED